MRVKKYRVNTLPEAMQLIKKDLGNDAVILESKKVKLGGILGFLAQEKVEVIAAVEQMEYADHAVSKQLSQVTATQSIVPKEVQAQETNTQHDHDLVGEIQSFKHIMMNMLTDNDERLPEPIRQLNQKYIAQGINANIRQQLINQSLKNVQGNADAQIEQVLDLAYEDLLHFIQDLPIEKENISGSVICFVGPTGVGKTTTIAKLAAEIVLKQRQKVGFITADTYRIAAVEQLRTYANILNLPLEVVYNADELEGAYERLQECDIILMDTPGRNYMETSYIEELKTFIPDRGQVQTQLVLSMTSKYDDIQKIIHNFKDLHIHRLALTKVDETCSYGMILNLLYTYSIPLTYLTNGQNVPDDIVKASPELIADMIWGGQAP